MAADRYFGTYARFETRSKKDAGALLGADNLVGDRFSIVFETEDGVTRAWMKNRFGALTGRFDEHVSRQLQLLQAREWELVALLSFVAFTDRPDPGFYWGQAVIIAFDPADEEAMETFVDRVGDLLQEGIRPAVDLGKQGVETMLEHQGDWTPAERVPMPEREEGTVIMKQRRKASENFIEQGRAGNKGCLAAGWLFNTLLVAVVVAAFAFTLRSCGVL
ncbi:hypothetical protein [Xiamenia xianingshaonis]|uniref:Uncharacterized protein n=1 Tax=Xiamenia xianingshaonis TaxID=2682776 RepID=A0A9E6SUD8_9ACTN|nr:hypothetical protein [Xiamenia xianingshaonis]NHM13932.1 hypothetical protein [Xiamenia xianingshaonis]QTU84381.1 hypothetical protein J7S26_00065 [Xiamenia xianingshaonis]